MPGHEGNTNKFPQGMETEILRRLSKKWVGDERIVSIIQDNDNKNSNVFNQLNWKIAQKIDKNHLKRKIIRRAIKFLPRNKPKLAESIVKFFSYLINCNLSKK